MHWRMPFWCLLGALIVPDPSSAGVIRGTLKALTALPAAPTMHTSYFGRARELPVAPTIVRGALSDAVVWVETVPAGADGPVAHPDSLPVLAQQGKAFVPRVLAVAVGTTVDMPNYDPFYHNVFSLSPVKRFDLGKYPRGQSRRVTFEHPGLVNVYCDIHSSMAAYVLVLPHHVFVRPDARGAFALPPLPAGPYILRVWHPDFPALQREVVIPEQGDALVELAL